MRDETAIQNTLLFNSKAAFRIGIDSNNVKTSAVVAKGVTIRAARFVVSDGGNTTLPAGTTFIVINNTAAAAINGAFTNLPDGSTVTVGSNTFQANYEGGDGNDLTLTVVP